MILPNKLFSYSESVIPNLPVLVKAIKNKPISINELFKIVSPQVKDTNSFIEALDCLYLLDCVEYDFEKGVLFYVVRN